MAASAGSGIRHRERDLDGRQRRARTPDRRRAGGWRAARPLPGAAASQPEPLAAAGADPRGPRAAGRRGRGRARSAHPVGRDLCRAPAGARARRHRAAGDAALDRPRGRPPDRHRQAQGLARAPGPRPCRRHAGQRAHRPLRRLPSPASAASSGRASCIAWTRTPPACSWWPRPTARIRVSPSSSPPMAPTAGSSAATWRSSGAPRAHARDDRCAISPAATPTAPRSPSSAPRRGRRAVTRYEVLATYPRGAKQGTASEPIASLLALTLETGRTHQVRAHLAHIGHPLLGDMTYGAGFKASARNLSADAQAALADLGRQALHAADLAFVHPVTGKRLAFESPPPPDMARLHAALAASR